MTSLVQSSYSELITYYCYATFRIDIITWKYRKTANIIEQLKLRLYINICMSQFNVYTSNTL